MEVEKTIDVLNTLVEINNDRIEGYVTASKETEEHDLKSLFAELALTSKYNKQELANEIVMLGGQPTEDTKVTGKFFRVWMDVKAAITGKDRKAILSSCEFGEDHALDTYEKVLKDDVEYLSLGQLSLIQAQHTLLKTDHNRVKFLHEALV
ncbi:MAG: PA2169 family four-helix-bundle protein [Prolixibacteraceae bacterium]|nr:PA2169 family four-helix-bundle protein [Prolixibacteraceae bacterium]